VLLKLSSQFKLRNFDNGMKMIAVAPHRLVLSSCKQTLQGFKILSDWCGLLFYSFQGNAKA
jgi:hypothetical protein